MSSSSVEKIKERLNVAEVIGSYIKLDKAGSNFKAKCPFHNEKTPSFFVSPDRGGYYCFGCGAKGDIFNFVEEFEGLDFIGALKVLAERAGVPLEKENPVVKDSKNKLYEIMEQATLFYQKNLSQNKEAMSYLRKRGLVTESFKNWRLGYAPKEWRNLYEYLLAKGWKEKEIEQAGLIKRGDKGVYDRFISRIIFPLFDSSGRVVAFSGRIFGEEESEKVPKYLNSPETPIFTKSNVFYGLNKAKFDIRKKDQAIFVEGQMDLLLAHQEGFTNTVGVSGTALTDSLSSENGGVVNNFGLIKRLTNNIVISYDPDEAGIKASERSAKIALSLGMEVKIAKMPEGLDPADVVIKDKTIFAKAIENAEHVIDFTIDHILNLKLDERKTRKMVVEKVIPLIGSIESPSEQSHFIKKLAKKVAWEENIWWEEVKSFKKKPIQSEKTEDKIPSKNLVKSKTNRKNNIERRLYGILLLLKKGNKSEDFGVIQNIESVLGKDISNIYKDEEEAIIFEAESLYGEEKKILDNAEDLILNLKEERLKNNLTKCMNQIGDPDVKKDKQKTEDIMKKIKGLTEEINEVRKKLKK